MTEPKKQDLTGFTPKTQGEIDRHKFAAATGGLVVLSAPAFNELHQAAVAWHEHAAAIKAAQPSELSDLTDTLMAWREARGGASSLQQASDTPSGDAQEKQP